MVIHVVISYKIIYSQFLNLFQQLTFGLKVYKIMFICCV